MPRKVGKMPRRIDATLCALLADMPPQLWEEETRRFAVVRDYLERPTQLHAERCAKRLGLSVRTLLRLASRQRRIRSGGRVVGGKLNCSAIRPEADDVIRAALDDIGPGATMERTRRVVEARCEDAGLAPPSSNAIRTRLHRHFEMPDVAARLGSDVNMVLDGTALGAMVRDPAGRVMQARLVAMIEIARGRVLAHSLLPDIASDERSIADVVAAVTPGAKLSRVAVTGAARDALGAAAAISERADLELDRSVRIRTGDAMLALFGLRLGRVRLEPRGGRKGGAGAWPLVDGEVLREVLDLLVERHNRLRKSNVIMASTAPDWRSTPAPPASPNIG